MLNALNNRKKLKSQVKNDHGLRIGKKIHNILLSRSGRIEDLQFSFWNSTLKEKPCGTISICRSGAGRPKPVMLNAQAESVIYFKTI